MIDTLRLNLIDCEIDKKTPLIIQPAVIDHSTGEMINDFDLFVNQDGKIIKGNKAYLNDEKFNLTINPTVERITDTETGLSHLQKIRFNRMENYQTDLLGNDIGIEDDVKGIFVQTSLPRLINETNIKTLKKDEQKEALKLLEQRLKSYGIRTNIYDAKLSRVDTFTNIKTDYNFFTYSNLFTLMECSRMKSIDWKGESFLWKNGQQELMIYDKIREMNYKNPENKIKTGNNILRIENRLLKKRKIKSATHFETLGELYKNYNDLKEYHKTEIEKKIFRYNLDEIEQLTEDDLKRKFINAKKLFGKRWFNGYCFHFGVWTISKIIDIDIIADIIDEIDQDAVNPRMKKSRIKKSIENAKFYFGKGGIFSDEKIVFKSNVELYNELKTKFYKLVA